MACLTRLELGIDIETYSSVDVKNGAYAYSEAPDFEVLLIGYKFSDDEEVKQIDLTEDPEGHDRFWSALTDPDVIKTAYNANFERTCLAKHLGQPMPPEQWRCTLILAVQLGLPRSLADVGPALGLTEEEQKKKTGAALIQYFCKPCKPSKANGGRTRNTSLQAPDKWELFKEYNLQDVRVEQTIRERLKAYAPDQSEQDLWTLDQEINDRGVLLDIPMAKSIVEFDTQRSAELLEEAKALTGLDNPNSVAQLKPWLQRHGLTTETLRKTDVADMLADESLRPEVRRVLTIRSTLSKTSVKKYQTMIDVAGPDNRARGIMQFYGGHTGRWAGRALQPQNLAKNTMPDAELDEARDLVKAGDFEALEMIFGEPAPVFSQLVRTAFIPSPGNRFVVSDFSAIEARVIAWIAGEDWRLEVFKNDGDIYCESASHIYHVPVVKHGVNGELRQKGKIAELALGYGGAVGAMKQMDTTGSVPEEEMAGIVRQWRAESPAIVRFWRQCEQAAIKCISGEGPQKIKIKEYDPERARENEEIMDAPYGTFSNYFNTGAEPVEFKMKKTDKASVLSIKLPSGRPIAYWDPKVIETEMGPRITYMTQNQTTRKWERCETYGGKLAENIVQSVARDCLAEKMKLLESMGYPVVFHVHDEMIFDIPKTDTRAAEIVDRVMSEPIDWAPGLPLKGGTYECDFYRKD